MNAKKRSVATVVALMLMPLMVLADTETVNGIKWTYTINDGQASLGGGDAYSTAVGTGTKGAITIPSILGGCPVTSIGSCAFYNCSKLTSVSIPLGVTSIERSAFYGCSSLTSVKVPSSVMSIGYRAFCGCSGLTTVTISEGVTSIGERAFENCYKMTSISIPSSVLDIGYMAFYGCSGLADDHGFTIIRDVLYNYSGSATSVVIPQGVTSIGGEAFYCCYHLASVVIPSGVTSIGGMAFANCRGLTSVTIPPSVMSIGDDAFYHCSGLGDGAVIIDGCVLVLNGTCPSHIELPEGTRLIAGGTFASCTNLAAITIPPSVTSIGDCAFIGCKGLASMMIPSGVTHIGDSAFEGCDGLTTVSIPSSVTSIGEKAFGDCSGLTSVTIPDGVMRIGKWAFSGCSRLASVTIPSSVTNIEGGAFYSCEGLTSVIIPSKVMCIGEEAFAYCDGLTSVTILSGVEAIGGKAFYWCEGLTSLTIPSSVKHIGDSAFELCYKLKSVTVPSSVKTIGGSAFAQCKGLSSLTISEGVEVVEEHAFEKCESLTSVAIPSSVTTIGAHAFEGCKGLTSVKISSGVTNIGDSAFASCNVLTSVTIPSTVMSVGDSAFANCSSLATVTISEGVMHIGSLAFVGCKSLTTVRIPLSMSNIEDGVFQGCKGLTDVILPPSVTSIGASAFSGCNSLTSVSIPSNVTSIGKSAFYGCSRLTTILIPSSVTDIGEYAFAYCDGLSSVEIAEGVKNVGALAFYECKNLKEVHVIDLAKWCGINFSWYSGSDGNPLRYAHHLYVNGKEVRELIIPDGVASIADGAFVHCDGLTSVTLPSSVASIGDSAFSGCIGLTSVTIPASVTKITSRAFNGCVGLSVVMFDGDCPKCSSDSFVGCSPALQVFVKAGAEGWGEVPGVWNGIPIMYADYAATVSVVDSQTGCSKTMLSLDSEALTRHVTFNRGKVYVIDGLLLIGDGGLLEIEPSTIVKMTKGSQICVLSGGSCVANGVIFTHIADDEVGGDTNGDGDATKPVMGAYKLTGNIYEDDATEERYTAPQTLISSISGTLRLKGHKVYLANSSITVNSRATLTLLPGAIIKFASGCSMTVNGTLDAQGTRAAPIVFTSMKDDEWGGDTNGDGEKTRPEGGNWTGLYVNGTANLAYCIAMYAAPSNERGNIECRSGGRLTMNGCTVAHSLYDGVWNWGGTIQITNSIFFDCGNAVCPYQGSTECDNCVMFECNYGYMDWSHWVGGTFRNCIFYGMGMNWSDTDSAAEFQAHSTVKNCCFYNPEGCAKRSCTKVGIDGCLYADPKFVDPDNGDFRIAADSPCVDAGDAAVAPELDYWGQPRKGAPDIGIYEVTEGLQSPVDLVPEQVAMDPTAEPGGELHVAWTMRNIGSQETSGSWRDKLVLTDATGAYSIDLGTVISSGTLAAGGSVACSAAVAVPATAEGEWHVAVHANCERDIFEGANTTNNVAVSAGTVVVAMAAAEPGAGMSGTASAKQPGVGKFGFSGEPMIGRIDAPEGTIVYFGNGFVPTADSFTARTVCGADGGIIGIPAGTTTGYVTVVSPNGKEVAYSLSFESGVLAVKGVSPARVPSSGTTGLIVTGANFDENCSVELTVDGNPGAAYVPEKVSLVSATQLALTVDCSKLQAGKGYAVTVTSADGAKATYSGAFTVEAIPPKAELRAKLDVPSAVRQGRTVTCWIDYENTGNVDMPAPVFEIVSEGQIFKVDGNVHSNSVKVMGLSADAPHGTLRPGEPQRLGVQVTCMAADLKWQLKSYHAAQEGAKTAKFSLRELYDDDWVLYHDKNEDVVVSAIRTANGSTWSDFYVSFGQWLDECDEMVVDYGVMKSAYARHLYRLAKKISKPSSVSSAVLESPKILSAPQCGKHSGAKTAADWKEVGNGAVYMLCPTCRQWFLLDKTTKGNFDASNQTYLICHGMRNSIETDWILKMGQAILARTDGKAMVLAVNWGEGAFGFLDLLPHESASYVPEVARVVFDQLKLLEIVPGNTTLIAHSHGGHVVGQVVYHYAIENGGDFKRMVGLDVSTTDWSVHGWLPRMFEASREFSLPWLKGFSPSKWFSAVEKHCKQSEFYKTSWDMSLEGPSELFAQWNFSVVSGEGEFDETVAGFMADKERERHSYAYEWFIDTIKNADGKYDNKGFNFVGDSSWKAICGNSNEEATGASDIRKPKKGEMAGVIRDNVYELLEIRSERSLWRYADLVLSGQDSADSSIANGRMFRCHSLAYDDNLSVEMPMSGAIASGQSLPVAIKNDADNRSVPFDELYKIDSARFEDAGKSLEYATFTSAWIVDIEGLGVGDWDWSGRKMSHLVNLLKDYSADEYVRKISVNNGRHSFVAPGKDDRVSLQLSFDNAVFDGLRPLLYFDDGGNLQYRHVLLVVGNSRSPFPMKWPDDSDSDLYPDDNFVVQEVVAVPQNTWAVISRRPAKANALKAMSFSASYASVSAFAPQLSENALKPGEVIPVTAAKDGTWSIDLDGSESFSLTDDALDVLSFTLPEYGATKGTVTLNGKGARYDMPWTKVSGQLPSGVDADGNPVCEGERYTVKLTVYTQEGDEASVSCVLDVRYAMDEDEGEDEDATTSTSPKSCDPNEMTGPAGVGEERFVKPGEWMTYTIYFENKEDAEAAAAQVTVTNPLSDCLDWDSFEMIEVGFGNQLDSSLDGASSGSHEVTMDGTNLQVRTEFEVRDGVAEWYLRIVDPNGDEDGWPLDMYAGFLPPNDPETHCGEGHITYRVKVREDAPANARIENSATIVFDYNPPIETDPAWWNTVYAGGEAAFDAGELTVDEGGTLRVTVNGGSMETASSVQVAVQYNTAAAADLDLKNATVDGAKPSKTLAFPVTLSWAAGEIGGKTVEIPVKADSAVENDEFLTLQLSKPSGLELGEASVCTVWIHDPGYDALKAKVEGETATKKEKDAWTKLQKAQLPYVRSLAEPAHMGKVSGYGKFAKGKKVTLKATAGKGYAFAGWYLGGELVSKSASYSFKATGEDADYRARFVTVAEDKASIRAAVNGMAFGAAAGDGGSTEGSTNAMCGVALFWPLSHEALSATSIKVTGLPKGLKYDTKKQAITGTPTAPGKTSSVKVAVTTAGKQKATFVLKVTVDPLPEWARGQFTGTVVVPPSRSGEDTASPLTMTVGSTGKVSGKFKDGITNWTFSASSFATNSVTVGETNLFCRATAKGTYKNAKKKTVTVSAPIAFSLWARPDLSPIAAEGLGDFADGTDNVGIRRLAGVRLSYSAGGTAKMDKSYGQVAANKTVKLTATVKKGYAFLGWYDLGADDEGVVATQDDGLVTQALTYSLVSDGATDRFLEARFVKESELSANDITLEWNAPTDIYLGVGYSAKPTVRGRAAVRIASVSGLPKGLSWKSGKVSGVPTKAQACTVKVRVALTTNSKKYWDLKVPIEVRALPGWAAQTFEGNLGTEDEPVPVTVTIGSSGKVSGKYTLDGAKWTFSSSSLSLAVCDEATGEPSAFTANVTASATISKKKKSQKLVVTVTEEGVDIQAP